MPGHNQLPADHNTSPIPALQENVLESHEPIPLSEPVYDTQEVYRRSGITNHEYYGSITVSAQWLKDKSFTFDIFKASVDHTTPLVFSSDNSPTNIQPGNEGGTVMNTTPQKPATVTAIERDKLKQLIAMNGGSPDVWEGDTEPVEPETT